MWRVWSYSSTHHHICAIIILVVITKQVSVLTEQLEADTPSHCKHGKVLRFSLDWNTAMAGFFPISFSPNWWWVCTLRQVHGFHGALLSHWEARDGAKDLIHRLGGVQTECVFSRRTCSNKLPACSSEWTACSPHTGPEDASWQQESGWLQMKYRHGWTKSHCCMRSHRIDQNKANWRKVEMKYFLFVCLFVSFCNLAEVGSICDHHNSTPANKVVEVYIYMTLQKLHLNVTLNY